MQTGFILGGIAIGVGVIVFMSAMLVSVQTNFTNRVLTSQPQIQIEPPDEVARPLRDKGGVIELATVQRPTQRVLSVDQWQTILTQMRARSDVLIATPSVTGSALAVRGDASRSVGILGMEPDDFFASFGCRTISSQGCRASAPTISSLGSISPTISGRRSATSSTL